MALLPAIASPMHGSYVPLGYATTSSSGTVIFNNIPQVYQDLMLVMYGTSTTGISTSVNNDGLASNFSYTRLYGNGSAASSDRTTSGDFAFGSWGGGSGTPLFIISHVLNYANTTTYKTSLNRLADDRNGSGYTAMSVALHKSTNAITSYSVAFTLTSSTGIAALYGVRTVKQ
jgi:hypothetical protein